MYSRAVLVTLDSIDRTPYTYGSYRSQRRCRAPRRDRLLLTKIRLSGRTFLLTTAVSLPPPSASRSLAARAGVLFVTRPAMDTPAADRARAGSKELVESELTSLVGRESRESSMTVAVDEKLKGMDAGGQALDGGDGDEGKGGSHQVYPTLSRTQAIMLVLSLTLAMVLNVRDTRLRSDDGTDALDADYERSSHYYRCSTHWTRSQCVDSQPDRIVPTDEMNWTGIEPTSYQWLISAYSLSFGSTLLLFGRLADIVRSERPPSNAY